MVGKRLKSDYGNLKGTSTTKAQTVDNRLSWSLLTQITKRGSQLSEFVKNNRHLYFKRFAPLWVRIYCISFSGNNALLWPQNLTTCEFQSFGYAPAVNDTFWSSFQYFDLYRHAFQRLFGICGNTKHNITIWDQHCGVI